MIKKALDSTTNKGRAGSNKPPTASSHAASNSRRSYARVTSKASAASKQRIYRSPLSQGAFPQPNFPKRLSVPVSRGGKRPGNGRVSDSAVEDDMMNSEGRASYDAYGARNSASIPTYHMPAGQAGETGPISINHTIETAGEN